MAENSIYMESKMSLIWWEKTVEYQFIIEIAKTKVGNAFFMPLDGEHERASDTIIATDNKWLLIEFKKDINSIHDEIKKFPEGKYLAAKQELEKYRHHLVIFGQENKKGLMVASWNYFQAEAAAQLPGDLFAHSTDKATFDNYLNKFLSYKKPVKNPNGGGNKISLTTSEYSNVVGVRNGKITSIQTLSDYCENIELTQKNTKAKTMHHSSEMDI
jgi:hypothetical protein